jgi:hypothetical protein
MKFFQCSQRPAVAHGATVGFVVPANEAPERGERNAMSDSINIDAGKSGGGPPQSKTLRAARKSWNNAKRLGVRQSSGALLREPRFKINPNGFMRSMFRRASGALATMLWFLAMGAAAETNNLSDAEIQGRQLAQQLCEARPAGNFTNSGLLKMRDPKDVTTEVFLRVKTTLDAANWKIDYQTFGKDINQSNRIAAMFRMSEEKSPGFVFEHSDDFKLDSLTVTHRANQPNLEFYWTLSIHSGAKQESVSQLPTTPFAGSDFWLCDLGLEFFHWPAQKVLPKTTNLKRGREYTLLESTNPNPATNGYSRVRTWIDKESGGILEAEAYDMNGKLLKDFAPKSFKKVNGQWELQEMEIRNVQTGSRTRLEFDLKK